MVVGAVIMNNELTAQELLVAIDKQWATTKDIMAVGCVGENRALKVKKNIYEELRAEGYELPRNKVPMEFVIKYFKLNIDFLKNVANERNKKHGK